MKTKPPFDLEIYKRAMSVTAQGAHTNSKRAEVFIKGIYPTHLTRGHGCYVWDTRGNRFIDFICGLGTNLIGYANDELVRAISSQAALGATLSLGSDIEVRFGERIKEFIPFIEKIKLLKTGSEACTAAITIARAVTGRLSVLSDGYHGWHPEFTSLTPPADGCSVVHPIKKFTDPNQIWDHVAAVIVEPVVTDYSSERLEYLSKLREACTLSGALLIFDETITAFRFKTNTVSQYANVVPDLICFGKALGGGLPLALVAGKSCVMEGSYFVSSTFAGDTISLASSLKFLDLYQNKFDINLLWAKGDKFLSDFNNTSQDVVSLEGYPTRSRLIGDDEKKALFMQEMCKAGILIGPSLFFAFPHIDVMDEVLSVTKDVCQKIRTGMAKLEGDMPKSPFAERVRGKK